MHTTTRIPADLLSRTAYSYRGIPALTVMARNGDEEAKAELKRRGARPAALEGGNRAARRRR